MVHEKKMVMKKNPILCTLTFVGAGHIIACHWTSIATRTTKGKSGPPEPTYIFFILLPSSFALALYFSSDKMRFAPGLSNLVRADVNVVLLK